MEEVHSAAAAGFDSHAEGYESSRPGYPREVGDWLQDDLELSSGRTVLEVGAGTGKFTARLLRTGAYVIAVEPLEGMRRELHRALPQVHLREGTARRLTVPPSSMDAIVCAQAFHWFADATTLAGFAEALKPGGKLGLIWNYRDMEVGWVAALREISRPYEEGVPRYTPELVRALFPAPSFGPLQERRYHHVQKGSAEQVIIGRTLSESVIAALPVDEQRAVVERIEALIARTPQLAGGAEVEFPYETHVYWAERL